MSKKEKSEKQENKKSKIELLKENNKIDEEIDKIMEKNFKDYKSQNELDNFIENRAHEMIKDPLDRINKQEKAINKRLKSKEKENEKIANKKINEGTKRLSRKLKCYKKLRS